MKILMITNDYPNTYYIGGQGLAVREIAQRLVASGHLVRILDADRDHNTSWNTLPLHEMDGKVEIFRLKASPCPKQLGKFRLIPPVLLVSSLVKSIGHLLWADVVHFHNFWATGFLMPLFYVALSLRKRYIFTPYYEDYTSVDPSNSYSYEKLLKSFCKYASVVTVLSKREAKILARFTDNIIVSPLGTDPDMFKARQAVPSSPKERPSPLILAVGTMALRKNYVALAQALAQITQPWRLIIVTSQITDPSYYEQFKKICRHSGIEDRIEVRSEFDRHKLPDLYRSADLFIMPSIWEAFGIAAAEAMACGIPAILSSNSLITDFLTDGENTIIVNAHDKNEIAQKIKELLDDRQKALAIGSAGRKIIREYFTWDRVATDYENIYMQATG